MCYDFSNLGLLPECKDSVSLEFDYRILDDDDNLIDSGSCSQDDILHRLLSLNNWETICIMVRSRT